MAPDHVNETSAARRRDRILADYADVTVYEPEWEVPKERFEALATLYRDGYDGGAYCWVVRDPEDAPPTPGVASRHAVEPSPSVLLALGRGQPWWSAPGGGREGDETAEATAVREVREETGIECTVADCFRVVDARLVSPGSDAVLHATFAFFEGVYEGGAIRVQETELDGAAWFDGLPDDLHPALAERAEAWEERREREHGETDVEGE